MVFVLLLLVKLLSSIKTIVLIVANVKGVSCNYELYGELTLTEGLKRARNPLTELTSRKLHVSQDCILFYFQQKLQTGRRTVSTNPLL